MNAGKKKVINWAKGAVIIMIGILASVFCSMYLWQTEQFMFNPDYKKMVCMWIIFLPFAVYEAVYGSWFLWCTNKNVRDVSIFKRLPGIFFATVAAEISALGMITMTAGYWPDAIIHVIINSIFTAATFGIALFVVKPF